MPLTHLFSVTSRSLSPVVTSVLSPGSSLGTVDHIFSFETLMLERLDEGWVRDGGGEGSNFVLNLFTNKIP